MKRMEDTDLSEVQARFILPASCSQPECDRPILARMMCKSHYDEHRIAGTLPDRVDTITRGLSHFFSKIATDANGCWIWQGALTYQGYGQFGLNRKNVRTHRVAYEWVIGPIPDGLELDHLCRVRACCNPGHLEPVTGKVNSLRSDSPPAQFARRSECSAGHAYTEATTHIYKGRRLCRICARLKMRRRRSNAFLAAIEAQS